MMPAIWLGHTLWIGLAAALWLHRPDRFRATTFLFAIGLGLGLTAAIEAVLLMLGTQGGPRWWQVQIAAGLLALLAIVSYAWPNRPTELHRRDGARLPWLILLAMSLVAAAALVITAGLFPHGRWDGWAIWTLRAAFLYQGGEQWRSAFDPLLYWSHLDYPLLLPLSIVRGWRFLGSDTMLVPRVVGVGCAILLMAAMALLTHERRGAGWACAAGLAMLSMAALLEEAAAQLADVPLALLTLIAAALLVDAVRSPGARLRQWIALGVWLGMAAWTKNEGLSLAAAFFMAAAFAMVGRGMGITCVGILLGFAPFAGLIAWQRLTLFGETDILQRTAPLLDLLLDPARHAAILRVTLAHLATQWAAVAALAAMLALLAARGLVRGSGPRRAAAALALALILHAAAAYTVYLLSPHPLAWLVHESVHRLVLQVWPTLLLLVAISGRPMRLRRPRVSRRVEAVA